MKNPNTFKSLPTYGEIESGLFHKHAVSTSTFMKEKSGYKRELLGTRYDGWIEKTEYKWRYKWSDGTESIKYTYR